MAIRDEGSTAASQDNDTPAPEGSKFLAMTSEHPALVVTAVGALLFAVRCMRTTHGDTYMASVLLTQTSLRDAIGAFFFSVAPLLLHLSAMLILLMALNRNDWLEPKTIGLVALSTVAYLAALFLDGWPPPLISTLSYPMALLALLYMTMPTRRTAAEAGYSLDTKGRVIPLEALNDARFITRNIRRLEKMGYSVEDLDQVIPDEALDEAWDHALQGPPSRGGPMLPQAVFLLALALLALPAIGVFIVQDDFWLPRERLVFKGETPFTGYVLNKNEDRFVILIDNPRIIIEKPEDDLEARDFCYADRYRKSFKKAERAAPSCP